MRLARGDVLLVMDADLSHPPEKIPELVQAVRAGTAFVIGSRYVAGGQVTEGWGLFRWLNSKVATLLAWPLTSAADPMAGFFALPRELFEEARGLDPIGYKIGLELMVKCGCANVREVPITFENRVHGTSKMNWREQVNYLRHLKRLYEFKLTELIRPIKFGLVGLSGVGVDLLALMALLTVFELASARAMAILLAMTWNFVWNRARDAQGGAGREPDGPVRPLCPHLFCWCDRELGHHHGARRHPLVGRSSCAGLGTWHSGRCGVEL